MPDLNLQMDPDRFGYVSTATFTSSTGIIGLTFRARIPFPVKKLPLRRQTETETKIAETTIILIKWLQMKINYTCSLVPFQLLPTSGLQEVVLQVEVEG